jgi:hypothetical protein
VNSSESDAAWKVFLESTPANTPVKIGGFAEAVLNPSRTVNRIRVPNIRIQIHCDVDGGIRWFEPTSGELVLRSARHFEFIHYVCRDCGRFQKSYAVLIVRANDEQLDADVMKLGEYLPFAAPISKRIAKLLEKADLEMYRKGTRSEAQGLGVGAATYFRRIVDSQWKLLVTETRDAAERLGVRDLSLFDSALKETQFSKAVELLRDAIPPKLLILDGANPLTLLYQPLSVGLHALSDEECLQQAADIRTVLTALLENIADVLKDQDELKNAAARLRQL